MRSRIENNDGHGRSMNRRDLLKLVSLGAIGLAGDTSRKVLQSIVHVSETKNGSERLRIRPNTPTLKRLREMGVFPHEHEWAITANSEAFYEIGRDFATNPKFHDLRQQEEVTLLYPAAGMHLGTLEMAFQIAEGANAHQINLTLTDIDADIYRNIDNYIRRLVAACANTSSCTVQIEEHSEIAHNTDQNPAIKHIRFQYQTQDNRMVSIHIAFELQMSGSAYYRHESMVNADIAVWHDMGNIRNQDGLIDAMMLGKYKAELYLVLLDAAKGSLTNKKHYLLTAFTPPEEVMDHARRGNDRDRALAYDLTSKPLAYNALGEIVRTFHGNHFGCGEGHWDTQRDAYQSIGSNAQIIDLDTKLFETLRVAGGEAALVGYALTLEAQCLPQESEPLVFNHLRQLHGALQRITNLEIRRRIASQACAYTLRMLGDHEYYYNGNGEQVPIAHTHWSIEDKQFEERMKRKYRIWLEKFTRLLS